MANRPARTASYRIHKPTGQAVVRIDGKDHYRGPHATPESHEAYDRLLAEWLANGRRLATGNGTPTDVTVNEVLAVYLRHAKKHYCADDGSPS